MIKGILHLVERFDSADGRERVRIFNDKSGSILFLLFLAGIYEGYRTYLRSIEPALKCLHRLVSPFQPLAEIPRDHPLPSLGCGRWWSLAAQLGGVGTTWVQSSRGRSSTLDG